MSNRVGEIWNEEDEGVESPSEEHRKNDGLGECEKLLMEKDEWG